MDRGFIDSIDIVIADVTSQPLTSTAPQVLQRAGAVNLSASSVTIVPRPNSSMGQSSISSPSQTSFQAPVNMRALSSDSVSSVGDGVVPHGQAVESKQVKEAKEYNDEEIIIEALRSAKDRLFMLKLGDSMENLIAERQSQAKTELPQLTSSYHRLLAHRCASYYKLLPETDPTTKIITVCIGPESKTPDRRILDLVPLEMPAIRPAFQIMRRSGNGRSARSSTAGDDSGTPGELSDVDPSETGSSRSNNKKHLTISQREAAYNEARSRIFMGFQGKTSSMSDKPHSASASSSNLSAESSSVASAGGGSSAGELDDGVSTAPTESDQSYPPGRLGSTDKRSGRDRVQSNRKSSGQGSSSHQRRNRAGTFDRGAPYNYNGEMDSPEEQPEYHPPGPGVDPATGLFLPSLYNSNQNQTQTTPPEMGYPDPNSPPQGYGHGHGPVYPVYSYPPPYLAPYGYYPYPYPPPPPTSQPCAYDENQRFAGPNPNDQQQYPAQPPHPPEGYGPVAYVPVWGPPPMQQGPPPSAAAGQQIPRPGPVQNPHSPQEYHHPQPQHHPPQGYPYPPPPQGHGFQQPHPPHPPPPQPSLGHNSASGSNHGPVNVNLQVLPPQGPNREPLSQLNQIHEFENNQHTGDGSMRRYSWGNGSNSGHRNQSMGPRSSGGKKPSSNRGGRNGGDNVSIASSSSSSSRRTPGSTPSHPLPPRPDWAVGLLPPGNGQSTSAQQQSQNSPSPHPRFSQQSPANDSGDFPPLSSLSNQSSERPPFGQPANVWAGDGPLRAPRFGTPPAPTWNPNANSNSNPIPQGPWLQPQLQPGAMNRHDSSSSGFQNMPQLAHSSSFSSSGSSSNRARLEEQERRFERPTPRGNVELFNPKGKKAMHSGSQSQERGSDSASASTSTSNRQRAATSGSTNTSAPSSSRTNSETEQMDRKRDEAVKNAILVQKIEHLSLDGVSEERRRQQ